MPRKLKLAAATLALGLAVATTGCSGSDKKPDKGGEKASGAAPCSCGMATPYKEGASCSCADVNLKKTGFCDHCGTGFAEGKRTACEKCARANKLCPDCDGGKPCPECQKKG